MRLQSAQVLQVMMAPSHKSSSEHTVVHAQEEFQNETVRKVQALHKYDCMRANKSTMAWGVEARVPFLDQ